ncbi:uncharacterized protein LOC62_07G009407 [Vanrija pseudolonga]|uniref:Uncharacterized protein n=1 Tax=Vanrija pseudolonga TaxID=143232 RepID=A0AAF0YKB2_9TREE|nr:hypothetical protein LOC62_07G009407 [Vanrija pseudolonga]
MRVAYLLTAATLAAAQSIAPLSIPPFTGGLQPAPTISPFTPSGSATTVSVDGGSKTATVDLTNQVAYSGHWYSEQGCDASQVAHSTNDSTATAVIHFDSSVAGYTLSASMGDAIMLVTSGNVQQSLFAITVGTTDIQGLGSQCTTSYKYTFGGSGGGTVTIAYKVAAHSGRRQFSGMTNLVQINEIVAYANAADLQSITLPPNVHTDGVDATTLPGGAAGGGATGGAAGDGAKSTATTGKSTDAAAASSPAAGGGKAPGGAAALGAPAALALGIATVAFLWMC